WGAKNSQSITGRSKFKRCATADVSAAHCDGDDMPAQATIQRLLAVHVAAIALLGTVLLGMGQEDVIRPLITFAAVVTAVYFVDLKRRFHLPRPVANLC